MKQKWWVMLVAFTLLFMSALTVNAGTVDLFQQGQDSAPSELFEAWQGVYDTGDYANDMVVILTLDQGGDETLMNTLIPGDYLVELAPRHAYLAQIYFMAQFDEKQASKFDDINLQVRFPKTLLPDNPNAIGFSVNGSELDTWFDFFGVKSSEALDLYCLNDAIEVTTLKELHSLGHNETEKLFADERGLPLSEYFQEAIQFAPEEGLDNMVAIRLGFIIYTMPHSGGYDVDGVKLNYWAGKLLMRDSNDWIAPADTYQIATLNDDDTISVPVKAPKSKTFFDAMSWFCTCILVAGLIALCVKARRNRLKGRRDIIDRFIDYLSAVNCPDDEDDS